MSAHDPLVEAAGLTKSFEVGGRRGDVARVVKAVDDVDLRVRRGETVGVLGESGCGKSTLGRMLVNLVTPSAGSVHFDGLDLSSLPRKQARELRTRMQMVFQDPHGASNPRMTIGEAVAEPLRVHRRLGRAHAEGEVLELLDSVGLDPGHATRYPHELSGGQLQRVGIARALALRPDLVVLDEPVSALDVSIRASIVDLLARLQGEMGVAYVFIGHDLSVVRQLSDRVAVMYLGRIVESGPGSAVFDSAAHPYTVALLSAVPVPDPVRERSRTRIVLQGEVPSPLDPPSGCHFRTRCWRAEERCASERPVAVDLGGGHEVACHNPVTPTLERLAQGRVATEPDGRGP